MGPTFQKCPNCGANVDVAADGREIACPYCGAHTPIGVDPTALAGALRGDAATVEQLFGHLAAKLAHEFPKHTRVETSGGFFSSPKVIGFEITLGNETLGMRQQGHEVVATRKKVVRGIALKNEVLPVDEWVDHLCRCLAELADESAATKAALARLAGKGGR